MRSRIFSSLTVVSRQLQWLGIALASFGLVGISACQNAPNPPEATESSTTAPAESLPPAPPPPPDTAFLALLSPTQTAQIRVLGLPLVLPTAIPDEFGVVQIETQSDERFGGYQILYRDGSDRCFLIEYTVGGVGDLPATENRLPLNPPILADDTVEYGLNSGPYVDTSLREQFPEPSLISDWLPVEGGFVRLAGAALINNSLVPAVPCTNLAVEEAVAIIDSLAVISEDIQGDGAVE
ncbi:MAG: hypothetical protein F6K00_00250 [Leptolyngbya sp. SIOISBB]|nr:hypothetical protein [Leptolyngbya sp. SIOISBB]